MLKFVYDIGYKSRTLAKFGSVANQLTSDLSCKRTWRTSNSFLGSILLKKNWIRNDRIQVKLKKTHFKQKRKRKRERNPMRPGFVSEMTVTLKPVIGGGRHSSADPSELYSCGPRFEFQVQYLCFLKFIFKLWSKEDKNKQKEAGIDPF